MFQNYCKTLFYSMCFLAMLLRQDSQVLSTGAMELHTLIGHGLIHSPAFALLSQRNTWKLWTGYNLRQSYTSRILVHMEMYKYETRQCSHTSRIRLDLTRTYKLQVTSYQPRPLSFKGIDMIFKGLDHF
jgi:hypothetical protein